MGTGVGEDAPHPLADGRRLIGICFDCDATAPETFQQLVVEVGIELGIKGDWAIREKQ